jgi:hypothetical protein
MGHRVVIVDGSPDPIIRTSFYEIGANVYNQVTVGMGGSRRELFTLGARFDSNFFIWLEPEKVDLIRWISVITQPILDGNAEIVVPKRTEVGWSSYPVSQMHSEKEANRIFADETGSFLDVMFGPVAFSRKALPIFEECNPKKSFGVTDGYIQQTAVMVALDRELNVFSQVVDFFYPPVQKYEEETILKDVMAKKRQSQFDDLTHSFRVVGEALKRRHI